jgi:hypothetical protein
MRPAAEPEHHREDQHDREREDDCNDLLDLDHGTTLAPFAQGRLKRT